MVAMTPTSEQTAAVDLFRSGRTMVIEAGAGTGKTSTLRLIAEAAPAKRIQYLAFNKAIVTDAAGSMPANVTCSTAHSLAYRAVGAQYGHRLRGSRRMRSMEIARLIGVDPISIDYGGTAKYMAAGFLGGLAMRAIERFCQTADAAPSAQHVPYVDGIDVPVAGPDGLRRGWANNREIARHLEPALRRAWADISSLNGSLPFKHGHYLKLWQLSRPRHADVILFDEAQDANPVMAAVVGDQPHAQVVYVGDSQQCQPAGTMVAVASSRGDTRGRPVKYQQVPIEDVQPGDRVLSFHVPTSFLRRTGSVVRRRAERGYVGETVEVQAEDHSSTYTPNHRCVARVGDALNDRWVVYLMRRGGSFRVGMVTGMYRTQMGDLGLPRRMLAEGADAAWVLSVHDTEPAARAAEMWTSFNYSIPSIRFRQGLQRGIPQDQLDAFWTSVGDLTERAVRCLNDHGRLLQLPFCEPGRRVYRNRAQVMAACNLLDGMLVLTADGAFDAGGKRAHKNRWSVASVSRSWHVGVVYSLDVEGDETYVADGIVTHNSIYEWTGAVNALAGFAADDRSMLTRSFRFGPEVAAVANDVLGRIEGADLRLVGAGSAGVVGPVAEPDVVLCRTNAAAVDRMLIAQQAGQAPHLVGGGSEVVSFAKAARELMNEGRTSHPELACFDGWTEVLDYVENDAQGGELNLLVGLVEKYGVDTILLALDYMPTEDRADLIVSTAHKAKGRQWGSVALAGDFPTGVHPKTGEPVTPETSELRLLYVAVTRAQRELDISACGLLSSNAPASLPLPTSSPLHCRTCGRGYTLGARSGLADETYCGGVCRSKDAVRA